MAEPMQLDGIAHGGLAFTADCERAAQALAPAEGRCEDMPKATAASPRGTMARLWQTVRWERRQLETLWRLAIDAVPLPGNLRMPAARRQPCGCGQCGQGHAEAGPAAPPPPPMTRQHPFWDCVVAKAHFNPHSPGA